MATQTSHKPGEWTWMTDAACRGVGAEVFFPGAEDDDAAGKAICGACSVRLACLAFAIEHGERFGIWGGLGEKERARMTVEERELVLRRATAA